MILLSGTARLLQASTAAAGTAIRSAMGKLADDKKCETELQPLPDESGEALRDASLLVGEKEHDVTMLPASSIRKPESDEPVALLAWLLSLAEHFQGDGETSELAESLQQRQCLLLLLCLGANGLSEVRDACGFSAPAIADSQIFSPFKLELVVSTTATSPEGGGNGSSSLSSSERKGQEPSTSGSFVPGGTTSKSMNGGSASRPIDSSASTSSDPDRYRFNIFPGDDDEEDTAPCTADALQPTRKMATGEGTLVRFSNSASVRMLFALRAAGIVQRDTEKVIGAGSGSSSSTRTAGGAHSSERNLEREPSTMSSMASTRKMNKLPSEQRTAGVSARAGAGFAEGDSLINKTCTSSRAPTTSINFDLMRKERREAALFGMPWVNARAVLGHSHTPGAVPAAVQQVSESGKNSSSNASGTTTAGATGNANSTTALSEHRILDTALFQLQARASRCPLTVRLVRRLQPIFDGPYRAWSGSPERALRDRFQFDANASTDDSTFPSDSAFYFWHLANLRSLPLKDCVQLGDTKMDRNPAPQCQYDLYPKIEDEPCVFPEITQQAHVQVGHVDKFQVAKHAQEELGGRILFVQTEFDRVRQERILKCNPDLSSTEWRKLQALRERLTYENARCVDCKSRLETAEAEPLPEEDVATTVECAPNSSSNKKNDSLSRSTSSLRSKAQKQSQKRKQDWYTVVRGLLLELEEWEEKIHETTVQIANCTDRFTEAEAAFQADRLQRDELYACIEEQLLLELEELFCRQLQNSTTDFYFNRTAGERPEQDELLREDMTNWEPHSHLWDREHAILIAEKRKLLESVYDTVDQVGEDYENHFRNLKAKREEFEALSTYRAKLREREALIRECVALERKDRAATGSAGAGGQHGVVGCSS
ncbi:unnamed protein product [Amoebophrya sp. A120]|nr:unnamed protein product [Amoebophrya sp. A120]|eukprot:GSA120T00003085001.1